MRSVKLGLVAAAMLLGSTALTTPAFATGNNNDCRHNCGGGGGGGGDIDIDNKPVFVNNPEFKPTINNNPTNINIPIAKGGEGGHGGRGGDGGDARAYGGDAKAYGGDAEAEVENSGNSHVSYNNERAPVNTAYSAGLTSGEDTCMGSSSIGGQAVSFGLTIGTTWTDDNCQRLKNSRQLVALGYHRAATSLMCFDESVREAMIQAGTPCPNGAAVAAYVAPPPPPAAAYVPMAPIVDDKPIRHKKKRIVRKPLPPK